MLPKIKFGGVYVGTISDNNRNFGYVDLVVTGNERQTLGTLFDLTPDGRIGIGANLRPHYTDFYLKTDQLREGGAEVENQSQFEQLLLLLPQLPETVPVKTAQKLMTGLLRVGVEKGFQLTQACLPKPIPDKNRED